MCHTSSSVYPVALPRCEPAIAERPSFLLRGFISASLSAHLAGPFALFPKLTAACVRQYACFPVCVPVLLHSFLIVSMCVCGCSVGSQNISISPGRTTL